MELRARLWPGLRTRGILLELALALVATVAVGVGASHRERLPAALIVGGSLAVGLLLATMRRRFPLVPFLCSAALAALSPDADAGLFLTSYAVGRYQGRWPVRVAAAATGIGAASRLWVGGPWNAEAGRVASAVLLVLLPGAVGIYVRVRALLLVALRERAESAESERELLARDAVLTERTRIAREMHDAVGHRVSLMVLQAGAIEMAAGDPDRVEQLAGQVQAAGRQALDELRQMVGVLRAGEGDAAPLAPQPGLAELPALVAQARDAGLDVVLRGAPEGSAPVDPAAGRAAYRIVQEALTNAGRHAPGSAITVAVDRPAGGLAIRVVNGPPRGAVAPTPGGGYGLVGLGERVRTLGGRLAAGPRLDGGFCVEAVLPT